MRKESAREKRPEKNKKKVCKITIKELYIMRDEFLGVYFKVVRN